jgi:hypothetical protein
MDGGCASYTQIKGDTMCKAFSCIVDISKKVTWKFGVDSHTDLVKLGGYKDTTKNQMEMTFARVEITPDNASYMNPDNWSLVVDESVVPSWFSLKHKEAAFEAHKKWQAKLYKSLIKKEIVHPFEINPPEVTEEHISWLREWDSVGGSVVDSVGASVGDSVGDSVWASVWASVGGSVVDSVGASVGDSVGDSVWASVWASVVDSVWASVGSCFQLPVWKGIKYKKGVYPFASSVNLWEAGLVPSFDGKIWRLHGGKKAAILFEISAKELRSPAPPKDLLSSKK